VRTALGPEVLSISKRKEGVEVNRRLHHDAAAVTAVTAAGATPGDKLLPPEGDATPSAIPCFDVYLRSIYKHTAQHLL
jgi:hypothetical protein